MVSKKKAATTKKKTTRTRAKKAVSKKKPAKTARKVATSLSLDDHLIRNSSPNIFDDIDWTGGTALILDDNNNIYVWDLELYNGKLYAATHHGGILKYAGS